mgnify:CR=1 FL=1
MSFLSKLESIAQEVHQDLAQPGGVAAHPRRQIGWQVTDELDTLAMRLVGASRGVIGIKNKYADVIAQLQPACPAGVDVVPLTDAYPAGDEFLLVHELTGRVVPEGGIPPDVGVVVNNVTTLAQIADAVEGRPVTARMVTVQGEVAAPGTFLAPIGTPIGVLIERAGGATIDDAGLIVGSASIDSIGLYEAVYWENGQLVELGFQMSAATRVR